MSKFDTHGGYFAPKDYLRVNEGGSHEENPNGGVQIGVDPEGNPNLLEEGEPVYKDYVYSDNIEAEKEFLEQNNLPGKYAGKLYSKIADDLFSEAEERPLDPTSRNGIEVMLGRLADAQEQQKQAKEQRDLEDELANLSPEELDQLEAMLAQGEQEQMMSEQVPTEAAPEEQMMAPAEPMPVEGMPMMKNGGTLLRKYDMGGPKKTMADEIASEILAQADARSKASGIGNTDSPLVSEHPDLDLALAIAQPGSLLVKALAPFAYRGIVNGVANGEPAYMAFAPMAKLKGAKNALSATEIANINGKIADYGKDIASAEKELAALKKELDVVKKGGPGSKDVIKSGIEKANERIRFAKREQGRLRGQLPKTEKAAEEIKETTEAASDANERTLLGHAVRTAFNPFYAGKQIWNKTAGSGWRWPATVVGGALGAVPATGVWTGIGEGANALIDAYSTPKGVDSGRITPYTGYYADPEEIPSVDVDPDGTVHACGGKINRFGGGGKKVEDMEVMAVDEDGNLIGDIEPSIVVAEREKTFDPYRFFEPRYAPNPIFNKEAYTPVFDENDREDNLKKKMDALLLAKSFLEDNDDNKYLLPLLLQSYRDNSHKYDGESERSNRMIRLPEWNKLLNGIRDYRKSLTKGGVDGTYYIDKKFPLGDFKTIKELEDSDVYRNFTDYVLNNSDKQHVLDYLRLLDEMVAPGVTRLFDGDNLKEDWKKLYNDRRYDQKGGVYHFSGDINNLFEPAPEDEQTRLSKIIAANGGTSFTGRVAGYPDIYYADKDGQRYYLDTGNGYKFYTSLSDIPGYEAPFTPVLPLNLPGRGGLFDVNTNAGYRPEGANLGLPPFQLRVPSQSQGALVDPVDPLGRRTSTWETSVDGVAIDHPNPFAVRTRPIGADVAVNPETGNVDVTSGETGTTRRPSTGPLPTWPRYAGAVGAGLLGLYNAFQPADRYDIPSAVPYLPEGRINLQNQVYNPVDQNMIANAQIAQGNATNRALRNSGLGSSAGAAILAADNNITDNLGMGFLQSWDANNQRRNAVIAANNQSEAQRAQFDYGVDAARKNILNTVERQNLQNRLYQQMMNNQAEGDKYTAISNQISNGLQALAGMGQENFAMNQVNSNPAFIGYGASPNGWMQYNPYYQFWLENKDK